MKALLTHWCVISYVCQRGNLVHPIGIKLQQAGVSSKYEDVQPKTDNMLWWNNLQFIFISHKGTHLKLGSPDFSKQIHHLIWLFIAATHKRMHQASWDGKSHFWVENMGVQVMSSPEDFWRSAVAVPIKKEKITIKPKLWKTQHYVLYGDGTSWEELVTWAGKV